MDQKKSESKKKTGKIVAVIIVIAVIIAAAVVVFALTSNKKKSAEVPEQITTKAQTTEPETQKKSLPTNFALFGVDTRDSSAAIGDQNRSDAIIIVQINPETNAVKLISVLRDSKVPIKGYEPQKINAAYKYGGAQLALNTLNTNFDLELRNYITVDFGKMARLIDLIGGVEVELTEAEANIVSSQNPDSETVYAGVNTLNGKQSVSFARIRSIDSDYERASRQQTVLDAVLHRLRTMGGAKTLDMLQAFMDSMETSFYYDQLYSILSELDFNTLALERYKVPDYDYEQNITGGLDETGSWVWQYDIAAAGERINKILGEDE